VTSIHPCLGSERWNIFIAYKVAYQMRSATAW
jgi:hypothetical protein